MTKIAGIITLYASQNFGAFLQGFAMQNVLERLGYKVSFLKYGDSNLHELLFMVKTKNIRLALFRVRQYWRYLNSRNLLHIARHKYLGEAMDAAIIGSDTLWDVQNPTIHPSEYYLGKNICANKIIAYAPSANNTTLSEFEKVYKQSSPFSSFTSISVRDHQTCELVEKIAGISPQVVLDPTLLLNKEDYPIAQISEKDRYVLVYGYSFSESEIAVIKSEAIRLGALTISVGLLNSWCDKNVTATVPEFIGYITKAECVFTGTFHGTIFSVIMGKRFVTFARKNYKVYDLLNKLELNDRDGSVAIDKVRSIVEQPIDFHRVHSKLSLLQSESMEFLRKALE